MPPASNRRGWRWRRPPATIRHLHEVGAGFLFPLLHEVGKRHCRRHVAHRVWLRLRRRGKLVERLRIEAGVHDQSGGDVKAVADRFERSRVVGDLFEQKLVIRQRLNREEADRVTVGWGIRAGLPAMLNPPPGQFSTTIGWPVMRWNGSPRARANTSLLPPAESAVMTRTGFDGKSCAADTPANVATASAAPAAFIAIFIFLFPPAIIVLLFQLTSRVSGQATHRHPSETRPRAATPV